MRPSLPYSPQFYHASQALYSPLHLFSQQHNSKKIQSKPIDDKPL
ncbi:MAG: hypothetical protein [Siphoviridae sp. ctpQM7]|nr:MAG: hypothetical protein [Siphoviridae sp. ctpQM7]